jgi:hypothetical protein
MTASWPARLAAYAAASLIALLFLYPYWWMVLGAFRSTEAVMTAPLRLWPESLDLSVFGTIARVGGAPLWRYAANSMLITTASTVLAVLVTALGAYAIVRRRGHQGGGPDRRGRFRCGGAAGDSLPRTHPGTQRSRGPLPARKRQPHLDPGSIVTLACGQFPCATFATTDTFCRCEEC